MPSHTHTGFGFVHRWNFLIGLTLFALVCLLHRSHADSKYDRDNWVNPDDMHNYDRSSKTMRNSKHDRENWVNPDDMLNYDRSTKTMKTKKSEQERGRGQATNGNSNSQSCDKCTELENELREQLLACETDMKKVKETQIPLSSEPEPDSQETSDGTTRCKGANARTVEHQYMKRFVNILLRVSHLGDASLAEGESRKSVISIDVSSEHLARLKLFVATTSDVSLSDVDDTLSHIFHSSSLVFDLPFGWVERLSMLFSTSNLEYRLVPYGLTLVVVAMLVLRRRIFDIVVTFLALVLILSYQCTHDHLLKKAEIDHYTTMKKYGEVPSYCRPPESFTDYAAYAFRYYFVYDTGVCNKVHEARLLDPVLQIPPTVVFAAMVTDVLVHPMGKFGEGIAKFSSGILGGLPAMSNWSVFLLVFLFIGVILILSVLMLFGRNLRFWSILGGVEVTEQRRVGVVTREAIQEVRNPQPSQTELTSSSAVSSTFVSAMSRPEGLVLMNVPVLERLMSGRQERPYVERLVPAETRDSDAGNVPASACSCRKGSSKEAPDSDPMAGGDGLLVGRPAVGRDTTGDGSFEASTPRLETSQFIEEVRKILEEDLSIGEDVGCEGKVVGPDRTPDVESLKAPAATKPGLRVGGVVSGQISAESLKKRDSSGSSDASEEFVKV